jgi:hypothetical protein
MHAVVIEFDFVPPRVALRRCVDQLGELRRDSFRQRGRAWTARYEARHAGNWKRLPGRRMRLLQMIDFAAWARIGCPCDAGRSEKRRPFVTITAAACRRAPDRG